jgi:hypothetical protein
VKICALNYLTKCARAMAIDAALPTVNLKRRPAIAIS